MKKVLIVGTSYTAGACQEKDAYDVWLDTKRNNRAFTEDTYDFVQKDWLKPEERWYQGLLEKYDVEILASSGCVASHQYYAIVNWLHQNPEVRFDAAIVEGRQPPSVSQPQWQDTGQVNTPENRLVTWKNHPESMRLTSKHFWEPWRFARTYNAHWTEWYEDYIMNDLSIVDSVAANWAIVSALELFCDTVKFFSFTKNNQIEPHQEFLYNEFEKQYGIPEMFNGFEDFTGENTNKELKKELQCHCMHYNKKGCKMISDYCTPIMEKELNLI